MRLDHLLSKEHLHSRKLGARARHRRVFGGGTLMGGTLTWGANAPSIMSTAGLPEWKRVGDAETFQTRCWVLRGRLSVLSGQDRDDPGRAPPHRTSRIGGQAVVMGAVRPNVENCTVDASIFSICDKLLRAHGGCLGIRSR